MEVNEDENYGHSYFRKQLVKYLGLKVKNTVICNS